MKYGYARVSTTGQDLNAQMDALNREGCEKIYSEKFTGTKADRPQFQALLKALETSDTLIITKLDRFARSTSEALEIVKDFYWKMFFYSSYDNKPIATEASTTDYGVTSSLGYKF